MNPTSAAARPEPADDAWLVLDLDRRVSYHGTAVRSGSRGDIWRGRPTYG